MLSETENEQKHVEYIAVLEKQMEQCNYLFLKGDLDGSKSVWAELKVVLRVKIGC